jgi:Rod binding domain-containing protein
MIAASTPSAMLTPSAHPARHAAQPGTGASAEDQEKLRETFASTVGQTFFGQMMKSMRQTVGKSKYFHGGRAEEIFQQQLDQLVVEKMSRSSASPIVEPMFDQFMLNRGKPS